jgi:putative phosphoribosyl transferase
VLRHQTERADLTPVASDHSDIHDAADPDRDLVAEPNARRSDDASLDGMAGDVRVGANDDVIIELEQVVITERRVLTYTRRPRRAPLRRRYAVHTGVPRTRLPATAGGSWWIAAMYRTHWSNGHSRSAIRISVSAGVRQPNVRVASADTNINSNEKRTYDGTAAALKTTVRAKGAAAVARQVLVRDTMPVRVPIDDRFLSGDLRMPLESRRIVLFAHGSGSSRHSPRNQYVAQSLERRNLATLLMDLLTPEEERIDNRTAEYRFDIPMLAERLVTIVDWLRRQKVTSALPIGLFGASTGGGAALMAAAERPDEIAAVVSRGGRPDLAGAALAKVTSPTLLIVGASTRPSFR